MHYCKKRMKEVMNDGCINKMLLILEEGVIFHN